MIALIILFFSGIAKGVMDTLQFHFSESIFAQEGIFKRWFWSPSLSWANKYVDSTPSKGRKKWFGLIPIPVLFTDGWHFVSINIFNTHVHFNYCIQTNIFIRNYN